MKSSNDMHELLNKLDGFHRAPYISFFLGLFLFFAGIGHWILSVINIGERSGEQMYHDTLRIQL